MKFLGWVLPEKLPAIKAPCRQPEDRPVFVKVGKLGFKGKAIRVLWLSLDGDISVLNELQSRVENGMHRTGFEKKRNIHRISRWRRMSYLIELLKNFQSL